MGPIWPINVLQLRVGAQIGRVRRLPRPRGVGGASGRPGSGPRPGLSGGSGGRCFRDASLRFRIACALVALPWRSPRVSCRLPCYFRRSSVIVSFASPASVGPPGPVIASPFVFYGRFGSFHPASGRRFPRSSRGAMLACSPVSRRFSPRCRGRDRLLGRNGALSCNSVGSEFLRFCARPWRSRGILRPGGLTRFRRSAHMPAARLLGLWQRRLGMLSVPAGGALLGGRFRCSTSAPPTKPPACWSSSRGRFLVGGLPNRFEGPAAHRAEAPLEGALGLVDPVRGRSAPGASNPPNDDRGLGRFVNIGHAAGLRFGLVDRG